VLTDRRAAGRGEFLPKRGEENLLVKGEDCAKNKDQPRSSKAVQKDWDW